MSNEDKESSQPEAGREKSGSPQPGDVRQTWADMGKARKLLDYSPDFDLETGLSTFIEWYKKRITFV